MKKCCAILATYNEADIIGESVRKLLESGVDVFVIDNGSTDQTLDIIGPLVGRGVVDVSIVRYHEGEQEVYDWTSILKLKQKLSRELDYDWYLHVDADEIRYSPWPHLSLREGLDRVDQSGYNLVNFKLFNFRLSNDLAGSTDYERDMPNYSISEDFNRWQIKAWKSHPEIDIVTYGGHIAVRPHGMIYPVRFIHKHYPVRSLEHGRRKILKERKKRFSEAEKQLGWHVQYNHLDDVRAEDVFWSADQLVRFEMQSECLTLLEEGSDVASRILTLIDLPALLSDIEGHLVKRYVGDNFPKEHIFDLIPLTHQIIEMLRKGEPLRLSANSQDTEFIKYFGKILAAVSYIQGDTAIYSRLDAIEFEP